MARLYNFQSYRSARQLNAFSQQAGQVTSECAQLQGHLTDILAVFEKTQDMYWSFYDELDAHRIDLQGSLLFADSCSAAWEMESVDDMIRARNKILQAL